MAAEQSGVVTGTGFGSRCAVRSDGGRGRFHGRFAYAAGSGTLL